jgi:hypothetical protein
VAWRADAADLLLLAGLVIGGLAISGRPWGAWGLTHATHESRRFYMAPAFRSLAVLGVLALLTQTHLYRERAPGLASTVATVMEPVLNARDAELQHRGYYEKLDNPGRVSAQLWGTVGGVPSDWEGPGDVGVLNVRDDFLFRDLAPDTRTELNGVPMSTNRWGMRDRDYALAKPEGTVRIALLGQSHVMGTFVGDDEPFDNVLEDRLNEASGPGGPRYEVLNFAVTNHSLTQELAMLEARVLAFEPDIVMVTIPSQGRHRSVEHLVQFLSGGRDVPYPELDAILGRAGLDADMTDGLPIPFETVRRLAESLGLNTRMPYTEAEARARDVTPELTAWTLDRIASVARSHGARPVLLGLDNAIGPPDEEVPELGMARRAGFVVLDLFDVYARAEVPLDDLRVTSWDNHPNALGHRIVAERLHQELMANQGRLGLSLTERN